MKIIRCICKNIKGRHIALGLECSLYKYKRRVALGEKCGSAKLKECHVRTIRDLIDQGFPLKQIASLYCVDISTVSAISRGKSWQHLSQNTEEENREKSA